MAKNPLYVMGIAAILILVVVGYRYQQYVLDRNFILHVSVPCDPVSNSCFVADCSPDDDPECDTTPYAKADLVAHDAPACLEEHTCTDFSCEGLSGCAVAYCSEDSLEEGELCSDTEAELH